MLERIECGWQGLENGESLKISISFSVDIESAVATCSCTLRALLCRARTWRSTSSFAAGPIADGSSWEEARSCFYTVNFTLLLRARTHG